jgi:hypothetical protein
MLMEKLKRLVASAGLMTAFAEVFLKLKFVSNLKELRNLLQKDGEEIKKKLPLLGLLVVLLMSGVIISWSAFFVIAVFSLHLLLTSWLQALWIMLVFNALMIFLVLKFIIHVIANIGLGNTRKYLADK